MEGSNTELLGQAADEVDNLIGALQLPLAPELHVLALKEALPKLRDALRDIYCAETGDYPWR